MSGNHSSNPSSCRPPANRSGAPTWMLVLTLILGYLGGVYFDHHSGWFSPAVYSPYSSSTELAAYQPKSGAQAMAARGHLLYGQICAACHSDDGMGKPGQAPPLAGSEWVNEKGFHRVAEIPQIGLTGSIPVKGQPWNSTMPPMGAGLSDADLAAVVTYVRSAWGNHAPPVTASDIKSVRSTVAGHPAISGAAGLKAIAE
ncbi:MAG: cytochrome c [Verrucomicrobia bacterium]|nr:cytochrome c [Verrucomicrobiota bacterium]MDE3099269.1 cytochrome c [Verrucomicrobiota bacterium]